MQGSPRVETSELSEQAQVVESGISGVSEHAAHADSESSVAGPMASVSPSGAMDSVEREPIARVDVNVCAGEMPTSKPTGIDVRAAHYSITDLDRI